MDDRRSMAGRRLEVALALIGERDGPAAADLAQQAAELDPERAEAWFVLAEALELSGRRQEASAAYRAYLAREPQDRLGGAARLALLGDGETPDRLPPAYVKSLFDQVAPAFEAQLRHRLAYRGPELLWALLQAFRERLPDRPSLLDLGCGTGLAGEIFRSLGGPLHGLDLSPGMLAQARAKGVYDTLAAGDILTPPGDLAPRHDLLVAADAFNYLGDLAPVFSVSAQRLRPGGLLLFSLEAGETQEPFALGPGQRYRHDPAAVRAWLGGAGFQVLAQESATIRREKDRSVEAWLLLAELRRPEEEELLALAGGLARLRSPGAR